MSDPKNTLFGDGVDMLARSKGGWPEAACVYALEMVNDQQVLLTGAVPTGHRRDGRPKFDRAKELRSFCTIGEYRTAVSA